MKKLYKIMRITDLDGVIKTDKDSVNRLGRIVEADPGDIDVDYRMVLLYRDDYDGKAIITSWVKRVTHADDGMIITTENSIYYLVEKDKAENYEGDY